MATAPSSGYMHTYPNRWRFIYILQSNSLTENQFVICSSVWTQGAVKVDSTQYSIGSERRRRPTGRWSSALTPISWEMAGTGCMRTEITEHALEIQLRCRLAGVEFPWREWMRMCMCGPEKEMLFTSSKVGLKKVPAYISKYCSLPVG